MENNNNNLSDDERWLEFPDGELRAEMARKRISGRMVIGAVGCSPATMTRATTGKVESMQLGTIVKIAKEVGLRTIISFEPIEPKIRTQTKPYGA